MRRSFLIIMMLFSVIISMSAVTTAKVFNCKTTHLGIWYDGTWYDQPNGAGIPVIIDIPNNTIEVYSQQFQQFQLFNISEVHVNNDGHYQVAMNAYDAKGAMCALRLVLRPDLDTSLQLYVHYNNLDYVYNLHLVGESMI